MLIDSHCHLDPSHFPEGPDAVLERARAAGVGAFVVIGVDRDLSSARAALDLARR
ncbi:MAG: TatD family hydrolase, partial [Polyangiaceae bacterium]|nr:TatD family hydrolase [Polyangiaceae bacterium]